LQHAARQVRRARFIPLVVEVLCSSRREQQVHADLLKPARRTSSIRRVLRMSLRKGYIAVLVQLLEHGFVLCLHQELVCWLSLTWKRRAVLIDKWGSLFQREQLLADPEQQRRTTMGRNRWRSGIFDHMLYLRLLCCQGLLWWSQRRLLPIIFRTFTS